MAAPALAPRVRVKVRGLRAAAAPLAAAALQ